MDKNIEIKRIVIPGLDILKFIMSLLIVAVHSEAVNDIPIVYEVTNPIINSAVPMFFVVSAFLLFRKMRQSQLTFHQERGIMLHFTWRLILLYVFWMVVQLPLVIHTRHYLSMSFFEFIYNFLLDIAFRSTFHGAWFFSALVVGTWLIYLLAKCLRIKRYGFYPCSLRCISIMQMTYLCNIRLFGFVSGKCYKSSEFLPGLIVLDFCRLHSCQS